MRSFPSYFWIWRDRVCSTICTCSIKCLLMWCFSSNLIWQSVRTVLHWDLRKQVFNCFWFSTSCFFADRNAIQKKSIQEASAMDWKAQSYLGVWNAFETDVDLPLQRGTIGHNFGSYQRNVLPANILNKAEHGPQTINKPTDNKQNTLHTLSSVLFFHSPTKNSSKSSLKRFHWKPSWSS